MSRGMISGEGRRHGKRRRQARGFIFVFGWRVLNSRERKPPVIGKCPACKKDDAELIGRTRRRWFTLFFIPILPLESAAHAARTSQCLACRTSFEMPIEQLARGARAAGTRGFGDAIALYNELRDRPADGATMLSLLETYESMGEFGEAESSARHFPQAVAAETKCAAVLARIRAKASAN